MNKRVTSRAPQSLIPPLSQSDQVGDLTIRAGSVPAQYGSAGDLDRKQTTCIFPSTTPQRRDKAEQPHWQRRSLFADAPRDEDEDDGPVTTTRADELLRKWAPGLYKAGGGAGWGDSMGVDSDLDTDTGVDDMDMSLGSSSCVLRRAIRSVILPSAPAAFPLNMGAPATWIGSKRPVSSLQRPHRGVTKRNSLIGSGDRCSQMHLGTRTKMTAL